MVKCENCVNAKMARHRTVYPQQGMATYWVIDKLECACKQKQVSKYNEIECEKFVKDEW